MLFRRLFLCASLVGLCAGLAYSAAQRWQVVPIIAAAEVFEAAVPPEPAVAHQHSPGTGDHTHDAAAWEPQDGIERTLWTVIANVLGATGFALLLIPVLAWWDRQRGGSAASWRSGLGWGVAGWLCVFVWPAIGMRPELPGEVGAALHARQAWWLLTVACAAGGFALLALVQSKLRGFGLFLLALPFLLGAPHAEGPAFAAFSADAAAQMEVLKSHFVVATAIASVVQWLVLGAVSGAVVARWLRPLLVVPSDTGAMRSAVRPSA
jgi:cobalt transporter subunit CbtA